jgi:hypothetical protein
MCLPSNDVQLDRAILTEKRQIPGQMLPNCPVLDRYRPHQTQTSQTMTLAAGNPQVPRAPQMSHEPRALV